MTEYREISTTAEQLRREFDLSFAQPYPVSADSEDLIGIRVGSAPFAVRLIGLTGVVSDRRITALPEAPAELLGIIGFRANIVPLYDLRFWFAEKTSDIPRWFLLARGSFGFAFDEVQGSLRVPRTAFLPVKPGEAPSPYIHEFVRTGDMVRPVIDIMALLQAIQARDGGRASGNS